MINNKGFIWPLMILLLVISINVFVDEETLNTLNKPIPDVSAAQAILINGKTGEVLYKKDADQKAYPASTTKIMTALVTLETVKRWNGDLDQKVKIPAAAVGAEGSSIYLSAGEEVSIRDLLYGLMLRSGNDAAVALSEIIGGSADQFEMMMNAEAIRLGCVGTHFINPNGLYDENHYTTVGDMAKIAMRAMEDETFREIVSAKKWQAGRAPDKYNYFFNKNKVIFQYEGGTGIKIGYTEKSGRTLVASAERDGVSLICVVMNAPDWFSDSYALMDYGFEQLCNR